MYDKVVKRMLDFIVALIALVILSPLLFILMLNGTFAMKGNPFFLQYRPGKIGKNGKEKIFKLIKFRTMNNKKNEKGEFLDDEKRLNKYGTWLRSTSLDELPELINILIGNMSIVGPRPQLIKDMVFMDNEIRYRHSVRPGLTGLAQVNGRNNITWEQKFRYDLQYIKEGITFKGDVKIILETLKTVIKRSDVVREGTASDIDYGDWLILNGKISQHIYCKKQEEAKNVTRQQ